MSKIVVEGTEVLAGAVMTDQDILEIVRSTGTKAAVDAVTNHIRSWLAQQEQHARDNNDTVALSLLESWVAYGEVSGWEHESINPVANAIAEDTGRDLSEVHPEVESDSRK